MPSRFDVLVGDDLRALTMYRNSSPDPVRLAGKAQRPGGEHVEVGAERAGDGCGDRQPTRADPEHCNILPGVLHQFRSENRPGVCAITVTRNGWLHSPCIPLEILSALAETGPTV